MSTTYDRDLKQRVISFLRMKNVLRQESVRVEVSDGLVTLTGRLRSYYERQLVISACQRVAGVISIADDISVIDEPPIEEIAEGHERNAAEHRYTSGAYASSMSMIGAGNELR